MFIYKYFYININTCKINEKIGVLSKEWLNLQKEREIVYFAIICGHNFANLFYLAVSNCDPWGEGKNNVILAVNVLLCTENSVSIIFPMLYNVILQERVLQCSYTLSETMAHILSSKILCKAIVMSPKKWYF